MNSKDKLRVPKVFTSLILGEALAFANVEPQVAAREQVAHQEEIFSVLEGVAHVYQEPDKEG